jgi:succinate dehydrogenase/fumarate reductase flavoprotein subunit
MRNALGLFVVIIAAGFAGCAATAQVHHERAAHVQGVNAR